MKRSVRLAGGLAVLLVFAGAAGLLYGKLRHFQYDRFKEGLHEIPRGYVAAAAGLTVVYYLGLIGYDLLAVRYVGRRLPLHRVALASFTGYASSYNFGILLGGASVRYRLYSAWGLSAAEIARLIVFLGLTFWLGVFSLGGLVFVLEPPTVPSGIRLPLGDLAVLGPILVTAVVTYLGVCAIWNGRLKLRDWDLPLPPVRMAVLQIVVASVDLMVGAGVFYALVSPMVDASYAALLGVYLMAIVGAVSTQVPGGLGVFELLVLVLAAPAEPHKLFAALVVWRGIFYLGPLLVAACLLGLHELALRLSRS